MTAPRNTIEPTEHGLARTMQGRHIRMIAIGGTIGTGLFLGSGKGISSAGPALIGVYAITGLFVFIITRALGELLMYRPVLGSFAEYAREFLGPLMGFVTGWGYWLCWTVTGMAEITAAGVFVKYWFPGVPQYLTALVSLAAILALNLAKVGAFGEAEFWFASIKVAAILALIVGGGTVLILGVGQAGAEGGFELLWSHGGVAPEGLLAVLLAFQIATFSYTGVEVIGMTAAEAQDREKNLPAAINSVPWRIGIFYVGSLVVLLSLFPWDQFSAGESPFVKGLSQVGLPAAAGVMNLVVLLSALSSCSTGLYNNARMLKKLAHDGFAPNGLLRTNRSGVPAKGVIASAAVMLISIPVNAWAPEKAFLYITSVATLGWIWVWAVILVTHLAYRRRLDRGEVSDSSFKLPFAKPLCWATLGFLAFVTVLLTLDADQRVALYLAPAWAAIMLAGYFGSVRWTARRRLLASVTQPRKN